MRQYRLIPDGNLSCNANGVDLTVLARVNSIVYPNLIYAGQALTIPDFTIQ
ncbi:MAG: hypothetical protein L0Z53_04925 [Acidobacteriales bacterium]|nr:hypothetical protein [Terriglobales bacterium]